MLKNQETILRIIKEELCFENDAIIDLTSDFKEILEHGDSLDALELAVHLEEEFMIELKEEILLDMKTVEETINYINKLIEENK